LYCHINSQHNFVSIQALTDANANEICKAELVPHNMVAASRMSGKSPQEAFDHIGNMLNSRYARWELAVKNIPSWGEGLDHQVANYIQGVADVVRANLHWR
jgi:hypothetical protein